MYTRKAEPPCSGLISSSIGSTWIWDEGTFLTDTHPLSPAMFCQHVSPWRAAGQQPAQRRGHTAPAASQGGGVTARCLHCRLLVLYKVPYMVTSSQTKTGTHTQKPNRPSSLPTVALGERKKSLPSAYSGETGSRECQ